MIQIKPRRQQGQCESLWTHYRTLMHNIKFIKLGDIRYLCGNHTLMLQSNCTGVKQAWKCLDCCLCEVTKRSLAVSCLQSVTTDHLVRCWGDPPPDTEMSLHGRGMWWCSTKRCVCARISEACLPDKQHIKSYSPADLFLYIMLQRPC